MTVISYNEAKSYAQRAGFSGDSLTIMLAIAGAESGYDTHPRDNVNGDGTRDRGILQINNYYHKEVSDNCAYDPSCAMQEGFRISSRGKDFTPWSTYNNLAYRDYMPGGSKYQGGKGGGTGTGFGAEAVRQSIVPRYTWFAPYLGPGTRQQGGHEGEDLGASKGSKFYFPESGSIYFPGNDATLGRVDPIGGYVLYMSGDSGLNWYFAHALNQHTFSAGARIKKGGVAGLVDNSGDAEDTPSHLHFQVGPGGNWGDPAVVLANGIPAGGGGGVFGTRPTSITVYDQPDFQGVSHDLTSDVKQVTVGLYFGHAGDIRSIKLHGGGSITLYGEINYAGQGIVASGDVRDTADILPWFSAGEKVVSSIRFGSESSGGGGGLWNVGSWSQFFQLNSLEASVHDAISTIPGFSGIVIAIDEAEEIPGWLDHGTDSAANIIRSVSDTVFSNAFGIGTRALIMFLGLVLMIGLLSNLVKGVTGVNPAMLAAL